MIDHLLKTEVRHSMGEFNHGADSFAAFRIRQPDHRDGTNSRMSRENIFQFTRRDVFAFTNDHILDAACQREPAVVSEHAEITGAKKTFLVERSGIERRVGVPLEYAGSANADFTFDTVTNRHSVPVDDAQLHIRLCNPIGISELFVVRVHGGDRDTRAFGHTVGVADAHTEFTLGAIVQLRRLRRAPATQYPQARQ